MNVWRRRAALAGTALMAVLATVACGSTASSTTPTASTPPPAAASPTGTAGPSASPTAPSSGSTLVIQGLGLSMTLPSGLNDVPYKELPSAASVALMDMAGTQHTSLARIDFSTNDCSGGATIVVSVWDVDPAQLRGQGYGGTVPGLDTHVGSRYLHIEGGDGYPPPSCSATTIAAFQQLIASATATP